MKTINRGTLFTFLAVCVIACLIEVKAADTGQSKPASAMLAPMDLTNSLSSVVLADLRCEYLTDPLGIDTDKPRLSWKLTDRESVRGQKQTGYQIQVASDRSLLDRGQADVWDSGLVWSSHSALVPFDGKQLVSGQDCYYKVRVFDKDRKPSAWSRAARFSIGLMQPGDWTGPWMRHPDAAVQKHIWFRKDLVLEKPLRSAFIHVASVGYHELYVNGRKVDDRILAPTLTRLDKRVLYVTYDIAGKLQAGTNTIALWQGPGWARYGYFKTHPALRVRLTARTADGKSINLTSGTDWRCAVSSSENIGGTQYNDNGGEKIDARLARADWNLPDFDDSQWPLAKTTTINAALSAQMIEPTRVIETIPAHGISGNGPYVVDMGKNFTGWLEIKMAGQSSGDEVTIQVADDARTVQDFGQKCLYVCAGVPGEVFRNRFNYVAGRYITISGLKTKPKTSDVTGYAIGTDLARTGHFTCSNPLFNRIYETDLWTFHANTTEGFTADCPHRERLGYGEVAFATAWGIGLPNYNSGAFYTKLVRDWSDVQMPNGWIHHTAPQINEHYGGPMWSSAGLNICWETYLTYGDERILASAYPSAKAWLDFLASHVTNGLLQPYSIGGTFLGDWAAPGERKEKGGTPEASFFNNCVYAMNLATFIDMASILNKPADAAIYSQRLAALKPEVHRQHFNPDKYSYSGGHQVHLAFPLLTGIVPETLRTAVGSQFVKEITESRPFLDMGSSGLPVLLKYLIENAERNDILHQLLSKTNEPGYGYFLSRGESTWPEYWNVDVPSRIHTCYTGIASWFIKGIGGIRPDPKHPGYQSFLIKPALAGDLTFAEAATESLYGKISSRWERKNGRLKLRVTIPPNSMAVVYVPTKNAASITEGGVRYQDANGIKLSSVAGAYATFFVESGVYDFESAAD